MPPVDERPAATPSPAAAPAVPAPAVPHNRYVVINRTHAAGSQQRFLAGGGAGHLRLGLPLSCSRGGSGRPPLPPPALSWEPCTLACPSPGPPPALFLVTYCVHREPSKTRIHEETRADVYVRSGCPLPPPAPFGSTAACRALERPSSSEIGDSFYWPFCLNTTRDPTLSPLFCPPAGLSRFWSSQSLFHSLALLRLSGEWSPPAFPHQSHQSAPPLAAVSE